MPFDSIVAIFGNSEGGHDVRTTLTGVTVGVDVSEKEKVWRTLQAIGDIAFAYAFSTVLIEIQARNFSISILGDFVFCFLTKVSWMI